MPVDNILWYQNVAMYSEDTRKVPQLSSMSNSALHDAENATLMLAVLPR